MCVFSIALVIAASFTRLLDLSLSLPPHAINHDILSLSPLCSVNQLALATNVREKLMVRLFWAPREAFENSM